MIIIGVDEVGRGPIAGPVVAAAVSLPAEFEHSKITDSKKLSKRQREKLFPEIQNLALDWRIVSVSHLVIDQINIREAARLAMSHAVSGLQGDLVLVDGNMPINCQVPQKTIIKGDLLHVQISAASILAKVWRDRHLEELDRAYPGYGLAKHAGYPTKAHQEAVAQLGPCAIHRRSFKGVKEFCHEQEQRRFPSLESEITIFQKCSKLEQTGRLAISETSADWSLGREAGWNLSKA